MKYSLLIIGVIFCCSEVFSQELHNDNNAVSYLNESNSITGWTGPVNLSSVSNNPLDGNFCFRLEITQTNQRDSRYSFSANIGEEYNISIWARTGDQNFKPAFANWQGVSGFSTRPIIGSAWTEYTFNVTATSTNPEIRIYVSPASGGSVGNHIFIDRVSISSLSPSDNEPPEAINDLSSTNIQSNSVSLNWSAPFDNVGVINYEIFRNNESIGFSSSTSINITNDLDPETNYSFNVVAIDAEGNRSLPSNTLSVITLPDSDPPNSINDLSSSSLTFSSVILNWTEPADNIGVTDFEVFRDLESLGLTNGSTTLSVTDLTPASSFNFTVVAIDASGNRSGPSNLITVITPDAPDSQSPDPIEDLMASNTSFTSTVLSWTTPFDNIGVTEYDIFVDNVFIETIVENTYSLGNLNPGTTYVFYVVALDEVGNRSSNSNAVSITTLTDNEPPSPITDLNATDIGMTSVNLNWSASSDNLGFVRYDIFRNSSLIQSDLVNATYVDSNLEPNTSYSYHVIAKDATGNSNTSNSITISTLETIDYTSDNANINSVDWIARDLFADRNVGIGTTNTQGFRLAVNGNIVAEEIKVALQSNWPDFVFKKDYELPSLEEVSWHIKTFGHLKNIPSAGEVEKNGIELGELNSKLLQKIEELTLYLIIQDKKIKSLEKKIEQLNP